MVQKGIRHPLDFFWGRFCYTRGEEENQGGSQNEEACPWRRGGAPRSWVSPSHLVRRTERAAHELSSRIHSCTCSAVGGAVR